MNPILILKKEFIIDQVKPFKFHVSIKIGMKATILSYRRGRHTQNVNQMLVEIDAVDSREKAEKLLGKRLVWKSPSGKEIKGEIIGVHGNRGVVRAKFEKNLPGQAMGTKVEVV